MKNKKSDPLKEIRPSLDQIVKESGVTWPVTWQQLDIITCQIHTSSDHRHVIGLTPSAPQAWDLWRVEGGHELCHGFLAETRDINFATAYFCRGSDENPDFQERARLFRAAWLVVEIWVNDRRYEVWPEFTAIAHRWYNQNVRYIIEADTSQKVVTRFDFCHSIAQNLAESRRLNQPTPDYGRLYKVLDHGLLQGIQTMAAFYHSLPPLPKDPHQAVAMLEECTQAAAKMFGIGFKPRLVQQDDCWVWDLYN